MQWYPVNDTLEMVAAELSAEIMTPASVENAGCSRLRDGKVQLDVGHDSSLSDHARLRLHQRGLSSEDVEYILRNGSVEHLAAAKIYFLRNVDIPEYERPAWQRLTGTAVITSPDDSCIITVWRNRKHGLRNLRRKRSQRWHWPTASLEVA